MANQEIHNYVNEQTTPNTTDYLDLDADVGGGNFLSKKLTFFNLRKWLFRLVSQDVRETTTTTGGNVSFVMAFNVYNVEIINNYTDMLDIITGSSYQPYNDHSNYVIHIHNYSGGEITLNKNNVGAYPNFITTENNPDITTTVGGYAQVWITFHKKADNTEYWTANTINFS